MHAHVSPAILRQHAVRCNHDHHGQRVSSQTQHLQAQPCCVPHDAGHNFPEITPELRELQILQYIINHQALWLPAPQAPSGKALFQANVSGATEGRILLQPVKGCVA